MPITTSPLKPVDAHVHIVGNGSSGSGCWMRVTGWHKPLAAYMLNHIGLSWANMKGDLDQLYVETLLRHVRGSSLGAIVILAHDLVYDENGSEIKNFSSVYVPNEYVLKLAREHPEFLPAVSIHPARPDALEELDRCLAGGAVMMKCLPNCHNIDCGNPRYKKFWERMAEAKLPLLAHTGGEHTVPVINAALADPKLLRFPLECGVTVIAAHCGTRSGAFDKDYFADWAAMLRKFPNLYGDISAMVSLNRCGHLRDCLSSEISPRILHGSDFPVPVLGHRLWLQGALDRQTFRRIQRVTNPLERDWQFKGALGFSTDILTRVASLLRLSREPMTR